MESKKIEGSFPADYEYDLPEELIAKYPAEIRTQSRLLDATSGTEIDRSFSELPKILKEKGPLTIVRNSTRVAKRRVFLKRKTGANIEALFLTESDGNWNALLKKAVKVKLNEALTEPLTGAEFEYLGRHPEHNEQCILKPADQTRVKYSGDPLLDAFFNDAGHVPLPPYMKRSDEHSDTMRYQTVYAEKSGSVAAPTAGLHFDQALIDRLAEDHTILDVYLDIGYGTFAPVDEHNIESGLLHKETYQIPEETARVLNESDRPVLCIGTTSLRSLESNLRDFGNYKAGRFETQLFLHPPHTVQACQYMITNFHLPASSLYLLVAAFSGRDRIRSLYESAVNRRYRFFSYGDATLLENQNL